MPPHDEDKKKSQPQENTDDLRREKETSGQEPTPPTSGTETQKPPERLLLKGEVARGAASAGDSAKKKSSSTDGAAFFMGGSYQTPHAGQMNLHTPDKIFIDLPDNLNIKQANLNLNLQSEKLPIGLSMGSDPVGVKLTETLGVKLDEPWWQRLGHVGATILAAVATVISVFVLLRQSDIQGRQTVIMEKQVEATKIQSEAARDQTAILKRQDDSTTKNLRVGLIREIIESDETKMDAAVMSLSSYGEDALPVIGQALLFDKGAMRDKVAEIVSHLYNINYIDPSKANMRIKLRENLLNYLASGDVYLQRGALACLIKLDRRLNPHEGSVFIGVLEKDFDPTRCREAEPELWDDVAIFLGTRPTFSPDPMTTAVADALSRRARELLLKIAETPHCGRSRKQAIVSLGNRWDESKEHRDIVLQRLQALKGMLEAELKSEKGADNQTTNRELLTTIANTVTLIEGKVID